MTGKPWGSNHLSVVSAEGPAHLTGGGWVKTSLPPPVESASSPIRKEQNWAQNANQSSFLFFKDFIYLFIHERERERERGRDTGRGRSRLHGREPNAGLDPGSPGSGPGPKAGAKPLSHLGCSNHPYFNHPLLCSLEMGNGVGVQN